MQFLSVGPASAMLAAAPVHTHFAEFFQRTEIAHLGIVLLALLVGGQIIWVLSTWAASKTVIHKDASTLGNAVKVWLCGWLASIAIGVGLFFAVPAVAAAEDPWRLRLVLGGAALLSLLLVFVVPMKIYVTGFLRALVVVLLGSFISAGVMVALELALIKFTSLEQDFVKLDAAMGKTSAERQAFFRRIGGREAPDEVDRLLDDALHPIGPRPTLAQREAMVRTLQQKLDARRRTLSAGNSAALAAFQKQLDRYMQFRNEVIAERQAPPAVAPHKVD